MRPKKRIPMLERLADNPSTPSVQFVALIDTQINEVPPKRYKLAGICTGPLSNGSQIVEPWRLNTIQVAKKAKPKSIAPKRYSDQPSWDQSSIKPTIMAMKTHPKSPIKFTWKGTINKARRMKTGIKKIPADIGFPTLCSASTAKARPLSVGKNFQTFGSRLQVIKYPSAPPRLARNKKEVSSLNGPETSASTCPK